MLKTFLYTSGMGWGWR